MRHTRSISNREWHEIAFGKTRDELSVLIQSAIDEAVAKEKERQLNNHFCCMYQTVIPRDFCDDCTKLTSSLADFIRKK